MYTKCVYEAIVQVQVSPLTTSGPCFHVELETKFAAEAQKTLT